MQPHPGKEILHPVAVTIFGGLISATLLDASSHAGAVSAFWTEVAAASCRRLGTRPGKNGDPIHGPRNVLTATKNIVRRVAMKLTVLAVAAALTTVTFAALAHAPKIGVHGGPQVDAGSFHVELVPRGPCCRLYLRDHSR